MELKPETILERFPDAQLWRLKHEDGSPYLDRYVLWGFAVGDEHVPHKVYFTYPDVQHMIHERLK